MNGVKFEVRFIIIRLALKTFLFCATFLKFQKLILQKKKIIRFIHII